MRQGPLGGSPKGKVKEIIDFNPELISSAPSFYILRKSTHIREELCIQFIFRPFLPSVFSRYPPFPPVTGLLTKSINMCMVVV